MMRAALLGAIALFAGCSAEPPPRTSPPKAKQVRPPEPTPAPVALRLPAKPTECPSYNASARVAALPVDGGAALVFVTTPGDTVALRRRVATLSLPRAVTSAGSRTDNIGNGVRLVFESDNPAHVSPLRKALDGYARDIAKRCGLTHAPPKQPAVEPEPSPSDPTTGAPAPKPDAPPPPEKPEEGDASEPKKPEDEKKNGAAPAPSGEPPPTPPKASGAPLPDPFKPPPPNLPSPPQNPF